ncbi:MAG: exodeoxyribonuclease V subunit beta [Idiomarina sp.]|nr:exodeoxyribonuclease V subunit beta [Idiomarina sp.]
MSHTLNALDFPLHGSRLIEASAGTGKTYTIAALFVRLVIQHGRNDTAFHKPLQPKNILVMTFTRAATAELADRIRARLSEAASYFRLDADTKSAADPFLQALKREAMEASEGLSLAGLARQLELAAQSMDEAAVSTIHGWCQKMLTEHAFASGSLFEQQIETDEDRLRQAAAEDYFRRFVYPAPQAYLEDLLKLLKTPEELLRKVVRTAPDSIRSEDAFETLASCCEQARATAQEQVEGLKAKYREVATDLFAVVDALPEKGNGGRKEAVSAFFRWVSTDELQLEVKSGLRKHLLPEDIRKKLKDSAPANLDVLEQLEQDSAVLSGIVKQMDAAVLRHAGEYLASRVSYLKQQAAMMGHDDMLTRLRDALRGPNGEALAATIRHQYPVALVDEFQDTDPVQYEIFDRIYRLQANDPESGIFLIGDPKQAIYSFRNADIFTYLKAREATTGRHYNLDTNYRSSEAMVAAVNELFAKANTKSTQGAFLYPDIPFLAVRANGRDRVFRGIEGEPAPALQWHVSDQPAGKKDDYQRPSAEFHANTIARLLMSEHAGFAQVGTDDFRRVQPSDIAVLVGNASEARLIRRALAARGIRSVYLSERDSVFGQEVAQDLLYLLKACAQPRDPSRVRTALATSLLHLPLAALTAYQENEQRWEEAIETFLRYHDIWQRQGVLAMLQRLLHDFKVPKRLLAGNDLDGERQLADILHMSELLQQTSMTLDGMASLEDYFAEQVHEYQQTVGFGSTKKANSESMQLRLESDETLVKVITYHKSKGLQYPLVFIPFAAYSKDSQYRIRYPATYHDAQRRRCVAWDGSDKEVVQRISDEILAEDLRKMYVALTRAEFATFVSLQAVGDSKVNPLFHLLYGCLSDTVTQRRKDDYTNLVEEARAAWVTDALDTQVSKIRIDEPVKYQPSADEQALNPAAMGVRVMPEAHRFERWWVASYSALKLGTELLAPQTPEEMNTRDEADLTTERGSDHQNEVLNTENQGLQSIGSDQQKGFSEPQGQIHHLPKGAGPGTFLHELLEDAAELGFAATAAETEVRSALLDKRCRGLWESYRDTLDAWLAGYLTAPFPLNGEGKQVRLCDLTQYKAEPEFWFAATQVDTQQIDRLVAQYVQPQCERPKLEPNQLNGMLKGFIDLVFEYEGRYYVADYKSNWLGEQNEDYSFDAMRDKILSSRYDLQYVLYTLALHKLLKSRLGESYDYDTHVGGVLYLFLRGHCAEGAGAFYDRPDKALILELEALFAGGDA